MTGLFSLVNVNVVQAADFSGAYIEVNPGYSYNEGLSKRNEPGLFGSPGYNNKHKSGFGINANLGYQFNQYVGLEVGATWFNPYEATARDGSEFLKIKTNMGYDLAGRFTLPIRVAGGGATSYYRASRAGVLGIFAKVGPGLIDERIERRYSNETEYRDYNRLKFALAYGGGLEYNVTNHFAINTQFYAMTPIPNFFVFETGTRMLISGGLKYTF